MSVASLKLLSIIWPPENRNTLIWKIQKFLFYEKTYQHKKYTFHHKARSCSIVKTNFIDKNQPDKLKYNRITAQGRFLENLIYQSRPLKGCKIVKTCPIFKIQKVFPFFTSGLAHQYWLNAMRLSVKKGFDFLTIAELIIKMYMYSKIPWLQFVVFK